MANDKNKKFVKVSIFVICGVLALFLVAYAIFTFTGLGTKENRLSTGTLVLTMDESMSHGISISGAVPVSDQEGKSTDPYVFSIENTGTLNASYRVLLVDDLEKYEEHQCSDKKMPWKNIKYELTKDGGSASVDLLSSDSFLFDTGVLAPGESKDYTLKLWIEESSGNEIMGTHFHGRIKIEAIQEGHTNYETGE